MRRFASLAAVVMLSGCSGIGSSLPPANPSGALPEVVQKGGGAQWVKFTPETGGTIFPSIVQGPDHNMWFLDSNAGALVRMTMSGGIKEFSSAVPGNADTMAVGADHKFYVGHQGTDIIRVTTAGRPTIITIPSGDTTSQGGIARGPDGNVWFTELNHIAKVTPGGTVSEFLYPAQPGNNAWGGITAGSDGNIWFAISGQNKIGKIVPATGKIKTFTISVTCAPAAMVLAKDHNVWFACVNSTPLMGRIKPNGAISTFAIGGGPYNADTRQFGGVGPDGEPWFAVGANSNSVIYRVNSAMHTATAFSPPFQSLERADSVATGPDGNLWVSTGLTRNIYVLVFNPMTVTPTKLTFTSVGQTKTVTVSQNDVTSWTAKSSNTSVATVVQGSPKSTFKVKSVGSGTCTITIDDGVHNTVTVKVTVP